MLSFKQFVVESTEVGSAWHGSPHSFDKFTRRETAHTGEGGAAYGSGIYISDNKKVGEHYRDIDKNKKGTLYQIHVKSDPKRMMHWNKPVSEQHEHVKKALKDSGYDFSQNEDPPARHVFHYIRQHYQSTGSNKQESSEKASKELENAGVHGITYEGDTKVKLKRDVPTNHVIFNPDHIEIKSKYDHENNLKD